MRQSGHIRKNCAENQTTTIRQIFQYLIDHEHGSRLDLHQGFSQEMASTNTSFSGQEEEEEEEGGGGIIEKCFNVNLYQCLHLLYYPFLKTIA